MARDHHRSIPGRRLSYPLARAIIPAAMQRFRAKLYKIGYQRCVDVPAHVSRALGDESTIPVVGRAANVEFRSTLTPRGGGTHRLFVHSRVWRARGINLGDTFEIGLERDFVSRDPATPYDFLRALDDRPAARAVYDRASSALRREIGNWLAGAKRPETRERRIGAALDSLEARSSKRKPALAAKWRR